MPSFVHGGIAEIGDLHQVAAVERRFVRNKAGDEVARGLPDVVGRRLAADAGCDEVVDQELVRAPVAVGQADEFSR